LGKIFYKIVICISAEQIFAETLNSYLEVKHVLQSLYFIDMCCAFWWNYSYS